VSISEQVDLAWHFQPNQLRDTHGRWAKRPGFSATALEDQRKRVALAARGYGPTAINGIMWQAKHDAAAAQERADRMKQAPTPKGLRDGAEINRARVLRARGMGPESIRDQIGEDRLVNAQRLRRVQHNNRRENLDTWTVDEQGQIIRGAHPGIHGQAPDSVAAQLQPVHGADFRQVSGTAAQVSALNQESRLHRALLADEVAGPAILGRWQFIRGGSQVVAEPQINDQARNSQGVWGRVVNKGGGHAVIDANDQKRHLVDWRNGGAPVHTVPLSQAGPRLGGMKMGTPRPAFNPQAETPSPSPGGKQWEFIGPHGSGAGAAFLPGNREPKLGDMARDGHGGVGRVTAMTSSNVVVESDDGNRYLVDWRNGGNVLQAQQLSQIPPSIQGQTWAAVMEHRVSARAAGAERHQAINEGRAQQLARQFVAGGEYQAGPELVRRVNGLLGTPVPASKILAGLPEPPRQTAPGVMVTTGVKQYLLPGMPQPGGLGPSSPAVQHLEQIATPDQLAEGESMHPQQGVQGNVDIVTLPNGEKVVHKIYHSGYEEMADTDELAYYVAQAIGAPSPPIARVSGGDPAEEVMGFVPGTTAARYLGDQGYEALGELTQSEDGQKIGLLDFLIQNPDRHTSNWMVTPSGSPVAIDNSSGFIYAGDGAASTTFWNEEPSNIPQDYANKIRAELAKLEPQFERLGHQMWYSDMMERAGELGPGGGEFSVELSWWNKKDSGSPSPRPSAGNWVHELRNEHGEWTRGGPEADPSSYTQFFHGTTPEAARSIRDQGLHAAGYDGYDPVLSPDSNESQIVAYERHDDLEWPSKPGMLIDIRVPKAREAEFLYPSTSHMGYRAIRKPLPPEFIHSYKPVKGYTHADRVALGQFREFSVDLAGGWHYNPAELRDPHGRWSVSGHEYAAPDPSRLANPRSSIVSPADHPFFKSVPVSPANIVAAYSAAAPAEKAQGMRWYADAQMVARSIAGGDAEKGAAVLAAFSPQVNWPENLFNAARSLELGRALGPGEGFISRPEQRAAQRAMDTGSIDALKSPKTRAFAKLIAHGGDASSDRLGQVVIDRHALSVAAGHRVTTEEIDASPIGDKRYYEHVADTYRLAAAELSRQGHLVTPSQLQAITWLHQQAANQAADAAAVTARERGRTANTARDWGIWKKFAAAHHVPVVPGTTTLSGEAAGIDLAFSAHEPRDFRGRWVNLPSGEPPRMQQAIAGMFRPSPGPPRPGPFTIRSTAASAAQNRGGFSVSMRTGGKPASGFMVAQAGHTHTFPAEILDDREKLARAIDGMIMSEHQAFAGKDTYLGGWVHDGKLWLEPSDNIASREQALAEGRKRGQAAIWDVTGGREIQAGGSGGAASGAHAQGGGGAGALQLSRAAGERAAGDRTGPGGLGRGTATVSAQLDLTGDGHGRHIPGTPFVYTHGWKPVKAGPPPAGDKGLISAGPYITPSAYTHRWDEEDDNLDYEESPTVAHGISGQAARPLTDAEFTGRQHVVEQTLTDAFAAGQNTAVTQSVGGDGQIYTPERAAIHKEIIDAVMARSAAVPNGGRAIFGGGLPGAGKTTALGKLPGMNMDDYLPIAPDDFKAELAKRGLVPHVGDLSPMEASPLVSDEAHHLAQMALDRSMAMRKNIIVDLTMLPADDMAGHIARLRSAGYGHVHGVYVDVPLQVSIDRALARYRAGLESWLAGKGLGGRHVPPADIVKIWGTSDPEISVNEMTFALALPLFDSWDKFDNSVTGREPQLVSSSGQGLEFSWAM
jgi:hypothetical protein